MLIYAALFILSDLLRPKPKFEGQRPAGLGDFDFPTATEARVLPLIWGRVVVSGPNVVWYGDLFQEPITQHVKTGLFSSTSNVIGFRYHLGVQMGLCRGPIDGLRRVWIGETEVFNSLTTTNFDIDKPDLFGGQDLGTGGVQSTVELYLGTHGQAVSTYLARFQNSGAGTTRTPNYTGTTHLVLRELGGSPSTGRGAYLGNSTNIQPWKFEIERFPAIFSGQSAGQHKISGADANPINVLYEILTNVEWGFGYPTADIDVGSSSSFKTASDTMISENNGFSMILDQVTEADSLIQEVLRQIDGVLFLNHSTGKWTVKLARADYNINTVPQLDESNVQEVREFTRGSWEDTTNQLTVKFNHRANDYKESFALAQDMANAQIQGGGTVGTSRIVSAEVEYPGVKDPALAAQIAWRDMRAQSYPLAKATLVVNRELWAVTIGDVVAWTDPKFDFVKFPWRIVNINYGRLQENAIELTVVQDIFQFLTASYGFPPTTGWLTPSAALVAFPSDEQVMFDAPRKFLELSPDAFGNDPELSSRIFAAARRQGSESLFHVTFRASAGIPSTPSGPFFDDGNVVSFVRIGNLTGTLPTASANPVTTVTISTGPDTQPFLESPFIDSSTLADLGQNLVQLIMIGNEFMLVQSASNSGANVNLANVYRGALDSAQESHASGADVFLLFVGAGLGQHNFGFSQGEVEVELRMSSPSSTYAGAVTPVLIPFDRRSARPYPAAATLYNGSGTPFTTPSLEGAGSGLNGFRVDVNWWRRDLRNGDEVAALLADDANAGTVRVSGTSTIQPTEYQLEVRADPAGANTLVGAASAFTAGTGALPFSRVDVITAAAAGTLLRLILRARHQFGSLTLTSRYNLVHEFTPTSALTGQFYFGGGLAANVASSSYTAAATGTFTLNIGAAQATANIQVSINGGAFTTVILGGLSLTTGTFVATSGDGIRVRRTVSEAPNPNFVELKNPSAVSVAYGSFKT